MVTTSFVLRLLLYVPVAFPASSMFDVCEYFSASLSVSTSCFPSVIFEREREAGLGSFGSSFAVFVMVSGSSFVVIPYEFTSLELV